VVIPAFNEDTVIRKVIEELLQFKYELVIVDDGSTINLKSLIKDLDVTVLRHKVNLGQGAAIQTGLDYSLLMGAKYIVTFDADGQHNAAEIERLLAPLILNNSDIVLGSRFLTGESHNMPFKRKVLIQMARYINYFFTGLLLSDAHNGMRAMTQAAARKIMIKENGMAHASEILVHVKSSRLRYSEVPVSIVYNDYSLKKGQSGWQATRILLDLIQTKIFR
jgi:polyprenyl-phospho-N-acetylgalactosaminyl synthase